MFHVERKNNVGRFTWNQIVKAGIFSFAFWPELAINTAIPENAVGPTRPVPVFAFGKELSGQLDNKESNDT
jgi:hypothetical protein